MHSDFSPAEHANFVAARVVAHATAFLDGRSDASTLYIAARSVKTELAMIPDDSQARAILDVSNLLAIAMDNASSCRDVARLDRWREVMASLADLVRMESSKLRETGAQRS